MLIHIRFNNGMWIGVNSELAVFYMHSESDEGFEIAEFTIKDTPKTIVEKIKALPFDWKKVIV